MHLHDTKSKTEFVNLKPVLMTSQTQKELSLLKEKAIQILRKMMEPTNTKLRVISEDLNKVIVDSHTKFGRELLMVFPKEKLFYEIRGLLLPPTNFISLVGSILVNYHVAFGDFSRIKECQNDDCEHIYFEKKKGESKYYSTACRVARNRKKDPEKQKCQQRQNKWIDGRLKSIHVQASKVYKEDCTECKVIIYRGECPIIREKNLLFLELLQSTSKKTKK
jgi:hypothetical protein